MQPHRLLVSPQKVRERAELRRAATRFLRQVERRSRPKPIANTTAMTAAFAMAARTWLARHGVQTTIPRDTRTLARLIIDVLSGSD